MRPLIVLLLAGCCTVPKQPIECVTRCGVSVRGIDCREAQAVEETTTLALGACVHRWTPGVVCEALRGWTLRLHERDDSDITCSAPNWRQAGNLCVYGYTDDAAKTIWIADLPLAHSSYAHEVVHVVDLAVTGKPGHCAWERRGIIDGIYLITGEVDHSKPESDCE